MIKFEVGQEVRFRDECWANNQLGVITEVIETGWTVNNEDTKYVYMVKLISQSSGMTTNFYDFELRLSKKERRNVNITQILS